MQSSAQGLALSLLACILPHAFAKFGDSEGSASSLAEFDPNSPAFEAGVHIAGASSVTVKDSFQLCGDKVEIHEAKLWEGFTLHAWGAEVLQQPGLNILQVLVMLREGPEWKMRWNELSYDRSDDKKERFDKLFSELRCTFAGGEKTRIRTVWMQEYIGSKKEWPVGIFLQCAIPTVPLQEAMAVSIVGPKGVMELKVCQKKIELMHKMMMYSKPFFGFDTAQKLLELHEWMEYHHAVVEYG
jgi:hypothetical protein